MMDDVAGSAPDAAAVDADGVAPESAGNPVDAAPAASTGESNWTEGLSDDARRVAEAKGWQSADEALKSYANLEKIVGRKTEGMVQLPTPDSEADQVAEFWQKLGRPETPDGYKLEPPEGYEIQDKEMVDWFRDAALRHNLPADMAQGIFSEYIAKMADSNGQAEQQRVEQVDAWNQELREQLGLAYDERVGQARRALGALAGENADQLAQVLEESGLGSFPPMVNMLIEASKLMSEDTLAANAPRTVGSAMTPNEVQSKINGMTGAELSYAEKKKLPYWNDAHPDHAQAVREVNRLYEMMDGDANKSIQEGSALRVS